MNWLLLVAGAVAAFTTVGHFVIGRKLYLLPMLAASFDEVARKVMHAEVTAARLSFDSSPSIIYSSQSRCGPSR